jgi:methylated-DNA-[protein]-cysteine S-methyltransferase
VGDSRVVEVAIVETRYAVSGWGVGELWLASGILVAHDFHFGRGSQAAPRAGARVPPTGTVAPGSEHEGDGFVPSRHRLDGLADGLADRFRGFLAGEPVDFGDVEIDLEWATPLQRELIERLRAVPRGEVVSYGELAALAGRPGAPRAAGALCSGNRFSFVVPCHRVVAASGIGGYGSAGVEVKRRLLALEGVEL